MLQIFNTVTDNIKEKVKNPFFATLIGVWLVRNWELVYTLFNFDNDCKLLDKVNFIKDYYRTKCFLNELSTNILIAFGLMIIGYVLVILTRIIVNQVEHKIIPYLNDKAANGLAVKQTLYQQVKKERFELQNDLEIANKKMIETEVANTKYKNDNAGLKIDILTKDNDIKSLKNDNKNLSSELELVKGQNKRLVYENERYSNRNEELLDKQTIFDFLNRDSFNRTKNIGIPKIIKTFKELRDKNLETGFLNLAKCINDRNLTTTLDKSYADNLSEMNLIEIKGDHNDMESVSSKDIELTTHGYSIFANKSLLEKVVNEINK